MLMVTGKSQMEVLLKPTIQWRFSQNFITQVVGTRRFNDGVECKNWWCVVPDACVGPFTFELQSKSTAEVMKGDEIGWIGPINGRIGQVC